MVDSELHWTKLIRSHLMIIQDRYTKPIVDMFCLKAYLVSSIPTRKSYNQTVLQLFVDFKSGDGVIQIWERV